MEVGWEQLIVISIPDQHRRPSPLFATAQAWRRYACLASLRPFLGQRRVAEEPSPKYDVEITRKRTSSVAAESNPVVRPKEPDCA